KTNNDSIFFCGTYITNYDDWPANRAILVETLSVECPTPVTISMFIFIIKMVGHGRQRKIKRSQRRMEKCSSKYPNFYWGRNHLVPFLQSITGRPNTMDDWTYSVEYFMFYLFNKRTIHFCEN